MGSILDNEKIVFTGKFHQAVHIASHTGIMNNHNRFRPICYQFLNIININVWILFPRIRKNNPGTS